jgi:uncharacterized protein involved in exopolysaccharide biosynthesis
MMVMAIIIVIGVAAAVVIPPSFTARARLLTLSSGVYELQPANPNNARVVTPLIAVDVEMQLLDSAELHRTTVRHLVGPLVPNDEFEKQVGIFEDHLKVSKLETGNVIEVTFRDRDPKKAANALQALLAAYFDERAGVLTSGRVGFLTEQRDKIKTQLDAANAQIEAYAKEHGVVDIAGQINTAVSLDGLVRQRVAEADTAVADAHRSQEVLTASAQEVPREVQLYSDNTEATHTIGTMEAELFTQEAKRADLASRYMTTSPFVKQADAQIAALKASIEQQKKEMPEARRTGYNTYKDTVTDRLSQAQATLAGAQARRSVLEGQMSSSQVRLKELITVNDTIGRLTSQRDLLAETAKDYSAQLEQARIQQNQAMGSSTTNVRVIEEPLPPRKRGNPPFLFVAAAVVAAVLVAMVVVIVVSSMRETFLTPEDAERALQLPVLCDVARQDHLGLPRRREFGRLIAALDSVPTSGMGKTVLLLTSQNEGKVDVVAQGLAEALEPRAPGRVAIIRMEEETEAPVEGTPLMLRPLSRDAVMNIGMTMTRKRLTNLFHEFRSTYDYVVITAPPASAWFESLELTTVADLSVMVVNAETTRKPVAQTVLAQAGYIGGNVDALVMTGRRYYIPAWLYRLLLGRGTV